MRFTWSAWVQEYKIGYLHFLDSKEHECDPEVCHFRKILLLQEDAAQETTIIMIDARSQESVLSAFADQEIPKSLGCPEYDRRVKGFEISKTLLTCNLNQVRSRGAVKPSRSMCFELLQRDMIDVHLNDESDASGCLFQPSVFCNSSSQKQLQEVTIRLSLSDSEGCHFLAVQEAPSGVECVAAHEVEGRVIFCESTYAGKAPCRVLYTGHETAGSASCCMVNNTTAKIRLQAPCGSQAMSHLSGQLLVCIAGDDKTSYSMRVSAEAIAVGPPRSVLPLLLPCTSKEPQRRVYALNREVQIEV